MKNSPACGRELPPIEPRGIEPPRLRPSAIAGIDIGELPDYLPRYDGIRRELQFMPTVRDELR